MKHAEFEQALATMDPGSLDPSQEALAEYWKKTDETRKHWKEDVVGNLKCGGLLLMASTLAFSLAVALFLVFGDGFGVAFGIRILEVMGVGVGIVTGVYGVAALGYSAHQAHKQIGLKRAIPELPPHYEESVGEEAFLLRERCETQRKLMESAGELVKNAGEIEASRAALSGYLLASGQDVLRLAEHDDIEERFAELENKIGA